MARFPITNEEFDAYLKSEGTLYRMVGRIRKPQHPVVNVTWNDAMAYSPQGDSPYGCADMSGNVWEWTHSLLQAYPYDAKDGREMENRIENHSACPLQVNLSGTRLECGASLQCLLRRLCGGPALQCFVSGSA